MIAERSKSRRLRKKEGDVVRVPLPGGRSGYGRVLADPDFAFYALVEDQDPPLQKIVSSPVLFRVSVMRHAVASGRWPIIGNMPLEAKLQESARYFRQDAMTGEFFIFSSDGKKWGERAATFEECRDLECLAVWEPEHVEGRIDDLLAGRPNKWFESMRPIART